MARLESLMYYLDDQSPSIVRKLSEQGTGASYDVIVGQTFKLKIRPRDSEVIVVDEVMIPDVDLDEITYNPKSGDFSAEGVYRAWIEVDLGGGVLQSTDEFEIVVLQHAPGVGVRTGMIARAARSLSPVAWDSLRGFKDYGDPELQRQVELAKLRVLKTVIPATLEEALDPRVVDYIAKKVLVDNVLTAVRDFWTNQLVSQTALGNSTEVKTYPDRIRAVEQQQKDLAAQLVAQLPEVEGIIPGTGVVGGEMSLIGGGSVLTPTLEDVEVDMYGLPRSCLGEW